MAGKANIGSVTVNPADATVLATTGGLVSGSQYLSGNYLVEVFVSSSVAATFSLQTKSGGSVVANIYIMIPANSSETFRSNISFAVADGLILQVVNIGAITGTVQANILWEVQSYA